VEEVEFARAKIGRMEGFGGEEEMEEEELEELEELEEEEEGRRSKEKLAEVLNAEDWKQTGHSGWKQKQPAVRVKEGGAGAPGEDEREQISHPSRKQKQLSFSSDSNEVEVGRPRLGSLGARPRDLLGPGRECVRGEGNIRVVEGEVRNLGEGEWKERREVEVLRAREAGTGGEGAGEGDSVRGGEEFCPSMPRNSKKVPAVFLDFRLFLLFNGFGGGKEGRLTGEEDKGETEGKVPGERDWEGEEGFELGERGERGELPGERGGE